MTHLAPPRTGAPARDAAAARPAGLGPTRTGRWLRGLAGLIGLVALLVGVPTAVVTAVGWPLPTSVPTLAGLHRAVTAPLSDDTLLRVLAGVAWLAWGHVLFCVLAEVRAQLRGRPAPRLPVGRPAQVLAARLVAAALVLLPATPGLTTGPVGLTRAVAAAPLAAPAAAPVVAATVPAAVTPAAEAPVSPPECAPARPAGPPVAPSGLPAPDSVVPAAVEPTGKVVLVQPPHGRWHDTLWDIAARHLGDPLRYPEIYQLNRGRLQPDGSRLTRESLIQPGWVLRLPADAIDAEVLPAPGPTAPDPTAGPAAAAPEPPVATDTPAGPGLGAVPAHPDRAAPAEAAPTAVPQSATDTPAPSTQRAPEGPPPASAASPGVGHGEVPAAVPIGVGVGLGALALLAAVERTRRAAGRRRRPGRRVAPVPPELRPV